MGDGENGSWVLGAGCWILVSGSWTLDTGFWTLVSRPLLQDPGFFFWDDAVLLTVAFLKNFLAAVINKICSWQQELDYFFYIYPWCFEITCMNLHEHNPT
jgi:hypothetical protein